ncbi:185_t:CDS:2 [Ambispora leptoticha]|uniref:185_t:CDS:1 n=1 Tax=Ambispora leptoticha TaxID=144679 RepID=A0A9N9CYC9_9GLOM|nr:185_t:CDS:2 [Ambispora leptoticha]
MNQLQSEITQLESNPAKNQAELESKRKKLKELQDREKTLTKSLPLNTQITILQKEIKQLENKSTRTKAEEALLSEKKKQLEELLKKQQVANNAKPTDKTALYIGLAIGAVVLIGLVVILNYPKEKRSQVEEIYLTEPNLEGELDLEDFTYKNYIDGANVKVYISLQVDETKLTFKNKPERTKISLVNAERDINYHYPTKKAREKTTKLDIEAFLTEAVNLEKLHLNNNKFTGSLDYLSNLKQLKELKLSNTDLNEVNIEQLPRSLEKIEYSTDKRPDCKLTEIVSQLEKYEKYEKDEQGQPKLLAEGGFIVVLKSITNSQNITLEFLNEIANTKLVDDDYRVVKCHGISQDPVTKNYLMVISYEEGGNLRQILQNNKGLSLRDKIYNLRTIANGLNVIHEQNLVHRDFHSGNIVGRFRITDLGLCQPVNYQKKVGQIFGVLPYIAPEVLQGQPYTQASDIYSWGIIAYEYLAQAYPYADKNLNDTGLALEVCNGLRPEIDKVPLPHWYEEILYENKEKTEFYHQYQALEQEYHTFSQNTPYQIHPTAITHSKAINTQQITQLLQKIKPTSNLEAIIEIPETSYSLEDDFGLDELNLEDTQTEQETTTSQIQIPPK